MSSINKLLSFYCCAFDGINIVDCVTDRFEADSVQTASPLQMQCCVRK